MTDKLLYKKFIGTVHYSTTDLFYIRFSANLTKEYW